MSTRRAHDGDSAPAIALSPYHTEFTDPAGVPVKEAGAYINKHPHPHVLGAITN